MSKQLPRILAVAPSTKGFGYAVLEGELTLVDWGVKSVARDKKNAESIVKIQEMIGYYEPQLLVLEDFNAPTSQRSDRIRKLGAQIVAVAQRRNLKVAMSERDKVLRTFFPEGNGTKYSLAQWLAQRFPEELGPRLPPKRRPWMSQDYRMDIFDAVALALVARSKKRKVTFQA